MNKWINKWMNINVIEKSRRIYREMWQWLVLSVGILHELCFSLYIHSSWASTLSTVRGVLAAVTKDSPSAMYWHSRSFSLMKQADMGVLSLPQCDSGIQALCILPIPHPVIVNQGRFCPSPKGHLQCLRVFWVVTTPERVQKVLQASSG